MVKREQILNRAVTTLNGAINSSTTSVTVDDGSVYPADGNFRIAIGNEILLVTSRATNVLTVIRGVEGSGGSDHADGDYVFAIATEAQFNNIWDEGKAPAEYANKLVSSTNVTLTHTDFSWVNQELSTVATETWGGLTMVADGNTTAEWRVLQRSQPSTPYTLTAHVSSQPANWGSGEDAYGIGFRESGTNRLSLIVAAPDRLWAVVQPTSTGDGTPTSVASQAFKYTDRTWLRVTNNGTNLTYFMSMDGWNWFQLYQELLDDHFTTAPDQICWGLRAVSTLNTHEYHLNAWHEE